MVADHLDELFALDARIAVTSPDILPLESPEELLSYLTIEHQSDTYIWNNQERELTGYVSVIIQHDDPVVEILNIGIDPRYQGQGCGQKLMQFAEQIARGAGKRRMKLVTAVSNESAQKFYTNLGYKIVGELENTYNDGKPRYRFEKEL